MEISKAKMLLEELVHNRIYVSNETPLDLQNKWDELKKEIVLENNIIDCLRTILVSRNSENTCVYEDYITELLTKIDSDLKMELLLNSDDYRDIIKSDDTFMSIWNSLDNNKKTDYLERKKKYTDLDIRFINGSVNNDKSFGNTFYKLVNSSEEIRKKIGPYSTEITRDFANKIDFANFDLCSIFTKESYTEILLKKCKSFDEFSTLLIKKPELFNLINSNSLSFSHKNDEKIYEFIKDNPNFIGKFNERYLDLFSLVEIIEFSKNKKIDSDTYSTIISKLFKYDMDKANELFSVESLNKCSKHSINVFPFEYLDKKLRDTIFADYSLFNKFMDVGMIEAINNYFEEDTILNMLRNDVFINDASSYAIELLLNKLSFKASFNMLQRQNILNKITNLNVKITENDFIFIKGFLDSPLLVSKSDHNMLYEMLKLLNEDEMFYYITLPYVNNAISSYEIISLCIEKKVNIKKVLKCNTIRNKFDIADLINLINKYWDITLDLSVFEDTELVKDVFGLDEDVINSINFSEVNYLFETIHMKSILSKQKIDCDIEEYRCVLISYMVLGLDETLRLVNLGNHNLTLEEIRKRQKIIIDEKLLAYKEENASIFDNMANKIISSLDKFGKVSDYDRLVDCVKNNTYLDNIVYYMLKNNYDTFDNIIAKFYGYLEYSKKDKFKSKKEIYDYVNSFISCLMTNKKKSLNSEFEKIILDNFRIKERIVYNERKKAGKQFLKKTKLKIFVRSLTEPDKSSFQQFFNDSIVLDDIVNCYTNYLKNEKQDFDNILEHILFPLVNDRFEIVNCLSKIGINKPINYDDYFEYKDIFKTVARVNAKLEIFKKLFSKEDMINILNYLCYGTELVIDTTKANLRKIDILKSKLMNISGELYIDKVNDKIIYNNELDIYNIDEINEYKKYVQIIEKIIRKTTLFINKIMIDDNILNYYAKDYFNYINDIKFNIPISDTNYDLKKRVLSLADIKLLFKDYSTKVIKHVSSDLISFIRENAIYYLDGYYNGLVNHFGFIISNWDFLKSNYKGLSSMQKIGKAARDILIKKNDFIKLVNPQIVNCLVDNSYYYVKDINERFNIFVDLYLDSLKKITSSIPFISYKDEDYEVRIIDNYDSDLFISFDNSPYKIGAIGNDLFIYSILSNNGCQIGIYKNNLLLGKAIGIRNGNVLYINGIDGYVDNHIIGLVKNFGNLIIKSTSKYAEPIELVTMVNNEFFNDKNGCVVDNTICPFIDYPFNVNSKDYELFKKYKHLIDMDKMFTYFDDNFVTIIANSVVIDKSNFKCYEPDSKYLRKRGNVLKLSNNIDDNCIKRINLLLRMLNKDLIVDDDYLRKIESIFLGDDFVIMITSSKKDNIYHLTYDKRCDYEINAIIKKTL